MKKLKTYIRHRIFLIVLMSYVVFSILLTYLGFKVPLIPCLYESVFGFNCLGCGLTSASIKLLELDFIGAFKTNCLIYLLIIVGPILIIKDLTKFNTHKTKKFFQSKIECVNNLRFSKK